MPPTCSLSAMWDIRAKHGIQSHTSKYFLEKEEGQHTQKGASLVKIRVVLLFILVTCGKTAEVLYLDNSSCIA